MAFKENEKRPQQKRTKLKVLVLGARYEDCLASSNKWRKRTKMKKKKTGWCSPGLILCGVCPSYSSQNNFFFCVVLPTAQKNCKTFERCDDDDVDDDDDGSLEAVRRRRAGGKSSLVHTKCDQGEGARRHLRSRKVRPSLTNTIEFAECGQHQFHWDEAIQDAKYQTEVNKYGKAYKIRFWEVQEHCKKRKV